LAAYVASEHHALLGHMDDRVADLMARPDVDQMDLRGRWRRHLKVRENDGMVARGMVKRFLSHRLLDYYDAEPARRRDWSSKIAVHVPWTV
jgi:hypothetical protein